MARKKTGTAAKDSGKNTGKAATRKAASSAPEEVTEDTGSDTVVEVNWNKDEFALTWSLLSAITDQPDIQNALYPPPGANSSTAKGGGKKTEYHWLLCKTIFATHPEYKDAFALIDVKKAAERTKWSSKIKNRLRAMAKMVVEYKATLGRTGEGIKSADDIGDTFPDTFRNKWEEVKVECPFFFEMRNLIAQRPNYTPVGLGNAATAEVDPDILTWDNIDVDERLANAAEEETSLDNEEAGDASEPGVDDVSAAELAVGDGESSSSSSDSDSEDVSATKLKAGDKRKAPASKRAAAEKSTKAAKKSTTSTSYSSASAAATSLPPTPTLTKARSTTVKGVLGGFADVIKTEEATRQQELELAKERLRYSSKKLQAKTEVKLLREKQKHELRTLQLQSRKDVLIAQLNLQAAASHGSVGVGGSRAGGQMHAGLFLGAPENPPQMLPLGGLQAGGFDPLAPGSNAVYGPVPDSLFNHPKQVAELDDYGMGVNGEGSIHGGASMGDD